MPKEPGEQPREEKIIEEFDNEKAIKKLEEERKENERREKELRDRELKKIEEKEKDKKGFEEK